MNYRSLLRLAARRIGFDVSAVSIHKHSFVRRAMQLEHLGTDLVLDVGANDGGFGGYLRELGYVGTIRSFEPLKSAYEKLRLRCSKDSSWFAENYALGSSSSSRDIHIAGNSESSSFLEMLPAHLEAAPSSVFCAKEKVEIKALDDIFDEVANGFRNVFLKIDTQGFEQEVLKGAQSSLRGVSAVQLEVSTVPLYEGALLFHELHAFMRDSGFELVDIEPMFADKISGRVLQADAVFQRQ